MQRGELLEQAGQGHRGFLSGLSALIGELKELRDRQNVSATTLSALAERIDERRQVSEALKQRFTALGRDTEAITTALN